MTDQTQSQPEALADCIARLGLTVESEFVPFSKSRHAKPDAKPSERTLNWKVTLFHKGHAILTTDYGAGIAHCPAYKRFKIGQNRGRWNMEQADAIERETETGRVALGGHIIQSGKPILPNSVDVIYSLASDAGALDHSSFADWASDYGYETDSIKAKAIYDACLSIALNLRAGLGEVALTELRAATQDY